MQAQLNNLTAERDSERAEKVTGMERLREARRQIEQLESKVSRLTSDLTVCRNQDRKVHGELEELQTQFQVIWLLIPSWMHDADII